MFPSTSSQLEAEARTRSPSLASAVVIFALLTVLLLVGVLQVRRWLSV
jgi:hypothetical protein